MSKKKSFNTNAFKRIKNWVDKVHMGDTIADQVKYVFEKNGYELEATPRRPDVRLVINNISGQTFNFSNPGNHADGEVEEIPSGAKNSAVQVMLKGETLAEQQANAKELYERFDMGNKGLTQEFVDALEAGELDDLIQEAYGPSEFEDQAGRMTEIEWTDNDKNTATITSTVGDAAAFGVRKIGKEKVFLAQFPIYIQGTHSVAELIESSGMFVALNEDWQTGEENSKPIVPSVGVHYYGEHVETIPVVTLSTDGIVKDITLANGRTLTPFPEGAEKRMAKKRQKLHARKAKEMAK